MTDDLVAVTFQRDWLVRQLQDILAHRDEFEDVADVCMTLEMHLAMLDLIKEEGPCESQRKIVEDGGF